jgi:hypothetical protein
MKKFEIEKAGLIAELDIAIMQNPKDAVLKALKDILGKLNTATELNGVLSRIVVDSLDYEYEVGEKIIEFEQYFLDKTNLIQSQELRQLAKYLKKKKIKIDYFGSAWTNNHASWIYFDTVLDLDKLRSKFNLGTHIKIHQNLDPKSGIESGFVDENTGEGLMGKLKKN